MAQATATNETQPFTLQIWNDWGNDPQESVTQNRWGKAGYIILNIIFPFILVLIDLLTSACLRCGSKSLKDKETVQIENTTDAATASAADAARSALSGEATDAKPATESEEVTPNVDGDNSDTPPTPRTAERLAQEAKAAKKAAAEKEAAEKEAAQIEQAIKLLNEKVKGTTTAKDSAVEAKTSAAAQKKVDAIKEAHEEIVKLADALENAGKTEVATAAKKASSESLTQAKQAVKALKTAEDQAAKALPENRHKAALAAVKAVREAYDKKHALKKEHGANHPDTQKARSAMIAAGIAALKAIAYSKDTDANKEFNYLDQRSDRGHWVKHAESAMKTT